MPGAERKQVQCLDEGVDHLNRVVRIHPVLEAFGQEGTFLTIRSFDKTTHPLLPHPSRKTLRDSSVSTQPGSNAVLLQHNQDGRLRLES